MFLYISKHWHCLQHRFQSFSVWFLLQIQLKFNVFKYILICKSNFLQQTTHALYGDDVMSHRQPTQRCCETGRPVATDPVTGSTICSCQIQPSSQSYLSRVPRLPEHIYGQTYSQVPAALPGMGQPAFYTMVSHETKKYM